MAPRLAWFGTGLLWGRGEGFFEDGLEEVGGVGAGVLDLRFKAAAGRHQRLHPLHDGGLLGEGWEGISMSVKFGKLIFG